MPPSARLPAGPVTASRGPATRRPTPDRGRENRLSPITSALSPHLFPAVTYRHVEV
jgi:hypothetical protein